MGLGGLTGLGGIRLLGRALVFVIPPLLFSRLNFELAWLAGNLFPSQAYKASEKFKRGNKSGRITKMRPLVWGRGAL